MQNLLGWIRSQQREQIAFLRKLVECESPSDDRAAVARFGDLFAAEISDIARIERRAIGDQYAPHLLCEFDLPGTRDGEKQLLVLGHADTVWPIGTLASMPWREEGGKLWGPGVFDMKGGLALFVFAMRGLRALQIPVRRRVILQINSDEEVGSESSRALTEEQAQQSVAVLVAEPSAGADGKLKTGRKGVGDFLVRVKGVSAHAGLDFTNGASAILELARQIEVISGFTDLDQGITVNPGVIRGGTRGNVIAKEAWVEVDMRIARADQAAGLEERFRSLKPFDQRCRIEVSGGLNRPPLERTPAVVGLYEKARELSREMGIELGETTVGGGSDGNFTAGLGIPTLDGLGAIGEGAHAVNESIVIDRMADRTALLAMLVREI